MKIKRFAVPALLLLLMADAGCVKLGENDIRGVWSFRAEAEVIFAFLFAGSREKGTLVEVDHPKDGAGSYTASGEQVEFEFISTLTGGRSCHFRGAFVPEDKLAGKMEIIAPYPPFAWTVTVEGVRL